MDVNLKRYWLGLILLITCTANAQRVYEEEYRPQFHFSPESGWIGDPDGLVKFQNKYHLFWWGHAVSDDLVHWDQKIYPMRGDDGSFSYYTGTVVVDKKNTSGFGDGTKPPMVAIYTAHNKTTGIQDQRISYSTDYELFQYFSGNPVLNIGSKEFRDPDVFWHEETNRWIMAITMAVDRRIDFYASSDLKSWKFLSSFGPVGAREQVWEVPQLLQLPVAGTNQRKWVIICSMGPNKMQYFAGDFDGNSFTLDQKESDFLTKGFGIEGEVFEDFENGFGKWTTEGQAFGTSPVSASLPEQMAVSGFFGSGFVNSYHGRDNAVGRLTSTTFTIEKRNINFLIGGGNSASTSINLVVNGATVRTASGTNSEAFLWKGWNVSEFVGKQAQLVILDNNTGGWGHINIDHIMFSDGLLNTEREHARWIDWGPDFYAGRAYRDYDNADALPVVWLGWMSNWEYANQTPTTWGRGAESVPRELALAQRENGYHLVQKPISGLQTLRQNAIELSSQNISGVRALNEFALRRNTFEMEAVFKVDSNTQNFGFNLFSGPAGSVVLGFDASSSTVYLDRRYGGNSSFSNLFPKVSTAPLQHQGRIKFHVIVDQSSIEVFVNDGEAVLTSLVFPYASHTGIEIFSTDKAVTLERLQAWELKSIWGIEPPAPITGIEEELDGSVSIFPNPAAQDSAFIVEFDQKIPGDGYVIIRGAQGDALFRQDVFAEDRSVKLKPKLETGLYFLELHIGEKKIVRRLLIR